ncbi:MAG: NAD+ synthase [Rhodocyclaceae bacterium]|nr:NAD+ synthase [Rhodocyclaceae bacterium]MCA3076890.1 NAD+ synthase [Rhodocyclaceae bacterium]MCA3091061.1 NAD+ synthase [Rhodocyclaceae bacterium]MCA3095217.1 NAD+ synthase [Rhodocyclaceae bacterium]MCA3099616.1 NAD+ synthase [Rhodocyclaceae bacterium]
MQELVAQEQLFAGEAVPGACIDTRDRIVHLDCLRQRRPGSFRRWLDDIVPFVKIALAQLNLTLGDLAGNAAKIVGAAHEALQAGATLLVTPELAICGYPPEDLLLREDFYRYCDEAVERVAREAPGITIVIGHPRALGGRRYNAASVLRGGQVVARYHKRNLPNYTVFDEQRYFDADTAPCVFEHEGVRFGINICEDVWGPQGRAQGEPRPFLHGEHAVASESGPAPAPLAAREAGAQCLLVLNASPYHVQKQRARYDVVRKRVAETGLPVVFVNHVCGQDELVFDGASFAIDAGGGLALQMPWFEEQVGLVEFDGTRLAKGACSAEPELEEEVYRALCLGVRDYLGKNGFPGALLGLSGGIDSALTLAIAVDAIGADKLHAVMMPSQYTAGMSVDDSRKMVGILGVRYSELAIRPVFDAFLETLEPELRGTRPDTTEENLQARIRGTLLMALSNKFGSIVLTTGNKSEMSAGYATLYGDMAGGFAVLKDISKTLVYRLSRWRNRNGEVIPQRIIDRPPSAELRPDQTDQDSLPEYDVLDGIIEAYVEHDQSPEQIVAAGFDRAAVEQAVRLIRLAEYKRRQAPVGIRVTPRGFGKDWRYPITNRFRH